MRIFIRGYKAGLASAKALRDGVDGKLIKNVGSTYLHIPARHLVVNWGGTACPDYVNMLNKPQGVQIASNKLLSAKVFERYNVPTTYTMFNIEDAKAWLVGGFNRVVYCRTILNGSQGAGIVVAHNIAELVDAQLYTAGITGKRREYRVHVFKGDVIHVQQKKRRDGWRENPDYNGDVRNLNGGWVFAMQDIELSPIATLAAVSAVKHLGLDFGGVDIVVDGEGTPYVIEVNTACGLEGTTVDRYCGAIKKHAEGL